MTEDVQKWADAAMFSAESHETTDDFGVVPEVHLLWMTPDPLGAIAAMSEMYKGHVVRDLHDISDVIRQQAFEDVQKTHLQAPLEAVKLHFMIEGVDRAFTHQMVRQRTAVYAQESLRFAVVEDLANSTTLPPSLFGTKPSEGHYDEHATQQEKMRFVWDDAIEFLQRRYETLVGMGMPQEDARGLLPHCTATRLNYITDLRNLVEHSGNRLCTQAQFHWRVVFNKIVEAIRNYGSQPEMIQVGFSDDPQPHYVPGEVKENPQAWQFQAIADSKLFRPKCYQLGHCPFQASFDRACKIRSRVEDFSRTGVPSNEWGNPSGGLLPIRDEEWLLDPSAARVRQV